MLVKSSWEWLFVSTNFYGHRFKNLEGFTNDMNRLITFDQFENQVSRCSMYDYGDYKAMRVYFEFEQQELNAKNLNT